MREVPGSEVDVVVVGGGPAGSAAALWCVRQGLRVVLLEREQFPRHRPGETLLPGVEPIFAQLGVAEAIARGRVHPSPGNMGDLVRSTPLRSIRSRQWWFMVRVPSATRAA